MKVGIPKEIMPREGRVAAIPETVKRMVDSGLEVQVEADAGKSVYLNDNDYRSAGARIITDTTEVFENADVILKVKEPRFNEQLNKSEVDLIGEGKTLITFIHPANNPDLVIALKNRRINALSMDCIPRLPAARTMDALSSMSAIAGYRSIIVGANAMPRCLTGISTDTGTLTSSNVLVVGIGVVGRQALMAAKGLGANIYGMDILPRAREYLQKIGAADLGFDIPADIAISDNGSAQKLPENWIEDAHKQIALALPDMDLIVLSALVFGEKAPVLITHEMISKMKSGSVIVDVSVDQGGNCESTVGGETVVVDGITIIGTANLPGQTPVHSSELYAKNICNFLLHLHHDGKLDLDDEIARGATVVRDGEVVHEGTIKALKESGLM